MAAVAPPAFALPTSTGSGFGLSEEGIPPVLAEVNPGIPLRRSPVASGATVGTILNQAMGVVRSQVAGGQTLADRAGAGVGTMEFDLDNEPLRSITETPEPGTLALMGLGVGMLFVAVRLRSSVRHK